MSIRAQYQRKHTIFISPVAGVEMEVSHYDPRSPEFSAAVQRLTRPIRRQVEKGELTPEQDRRYTIQAFAEVCLKNWRTVDPDGNVVNPTAIEEDAGKWVTFSRENAIRLFTEYPGLFSDVVDLARDNTAFRLTEDEMGNSEKS